MAMSDLAARLPMFVEREKSVLVTSLNDPACFKSAIETGLLAREFTFLEHARAWSAMMRIHGRGEHPSLPVLLDEYPQDIEFIGFLKSIGQSWENDSYNLKSNAMAIRRTFLQRDALKRIEQTRMNLQMTGASPEEIVSQLGELAVSISAQTPIPKDEGLGRNKNSLFCTGADLSTESVPTEFEIYPFAPRGAISDLCGSMKLAGKSTLIAHAVAAKPEGRDFLGYPTKPGPVVWLTEQTKSSFKSTIKGTGLAGKAGLHILYYPDTWGMKWPEVCDLAITKCQEVGSTLLVVDTLSQFAGLGKDDENDSGAAFMAMRPLQKAAALDITVLTSSHERKSGGEIGVSRRGSGAFTGAVDLVCSLRRLEGQGRSTMRRLSCLGRYDDIPEGLVIELTDGGYVSHGSESAVAERQAEEFILENVPRTEAEAAELTALIEGSAPKIVRSTAQRAVKTLLMEGKIVRLGMGKRKDPYRYFRPEKVSAQTRTPIGGQKETTTSYEDEERAAILEEARPTLSTSTQPVIF